MNPKVRAVLCWCLLAALLPVGGVMLSMQLTIAGLSPSEVAREMGRAAFVLALVAAYMGGSALMRRYRLRKPSVS